MLKFLIFLNIIILFLLIKKLLRDDVSKKPKLLAATLNSTKIEKGTFNYHYIHGGGPYVLNITSITGDVDVYISDTNPQPTYDPETYSMHSATCGSEILDIEESIQTPLSIGVYGYAESSVYLLELYENINVLYPFKKEISIEENLEVPRDRTNEEKTKQVQSKMKNKNYLGLPDVFSILEVLQLIF
ncbi:hypothetical protein ABEB36_013135 [Hypothenemus hampei]|uniref:Uncharacterized protein n=1 Tax=Hypothenemus hampei TaxID=57062 RepID=A0ABD1E703_HYPHA